MAYVGAPYNFIPRPERIAARTANSIPAHNSAPSRELLSGEIAYTVEAKTDIIVGGLDGEHFFRDIQGRYAIPGSSMRGLVRSNMQILGFSDIKEDVDGDYLMMYRRLAGDKTLRDEYSKVVGSPKKNRKGEGDEETIPKNVECGMLYSDGKDYWIIPSQTETIGESGSRRNFYLLRESKIIKDLQDKRDEDDYSNSNFHYLIEKGNSTLMYQYQGDEYPFFQDGKGKKWLSNHDFLPGYFRISFKTSSNKTVIAVGKPGAFKGKDCHEGYFVSSGFMNNKKAHYIVEITPGYTSDKNDKNAIYLDEKEIRAYRIDFNGRKNTLGTTQPGKTKKTKQAYLAFYELPEHKKISRPVFFIRREKNEAGFVYFGFTPNLRIFYNHTIKDAMPQASVYALYASSKKDKITDLTSAIMGYTRHGKKSDESPYVKGSRKSRLSFENATMTNSSKEKNLQKLILGGPKPTSIFDYLIQDKDHTVTYNQEKIEIRGQKQYWLHQDAQDNKAPKSEIDENNRKERVYTYYQPLKAGCTFEGRIHFHQLEPRELGLVLWSLLLEENSQQNIGKSKAQGYGRISIQADSLNIYDYEKMYDLSALDFAPFKEIQDTKEEIAKYINIYKTFIKESYGIDAMKEPSVQRLLLMKDSDEIPENSEQEKKTVYMTIKEYQDRWKEQSPALPQPEKIVGKELAEPERTGPSEDVMVVIERIIIPTEEPSEQEIVESTETAEEAPKIETVEVVEEGAIVKGIVNGFLKTPNGLGKKGVFLTLPGGKDKGLLHRDKMNEETLERLKVSEGLKTGETQLIVKIEKITIKGKKKTIALTQKDLF